MDPHPLLSLLKKCVVRIDVEGDFRGSGFFVAPGEVVTCAHVVEGAEKVTVSGSEWEAEAVVRDRVPDLPAGVAVGFQPPDLARLELEGGRGEHPCVRLADELPRAGARPDVLYLHAYTRGEYAPDQVRSSTASVEYVGPLEMDIPILKLAKGQIIGGFSGAPTLNLRTGSVVGVIDSSRNEATDLGGFGVPAAAVAEAFDGLLERSAAFHRENPEWDDCLEAERVEIARRNNGVRPLSEPLVDLDWRDGDPPSRLLRPRFGVVGMVGREGILGQLMRWRESSETVSVAVLSGGGGFGKTRLALEECAAAERAGWTAGLLGDGEGATSPAALQKVVDWPGRMVIAIDYAETRPVVVSNLLDRFLARTEGHPVRIILVCRQLLEKSELERTFGRRGDREKIEKVLRRSEPVRLDEQRIDRHKLFAHGASAMASHLRRDLPELGSPALEGEHFERPLFVLAAALLWLEDQSLDVDALDRRSLMLEMLDKHEAQYWENWSKRLELDLDADLQRRAVAAAAALGAESEDEALSLVRSVPGLEGFDAARQRKIALWLGHLYGSGRLNEAPAIAPIEPDSLAEALITEEYRSCPELLTKTLAAASQPQRDRFLTIITRAAEGEGREAPIEFALEVFGQAAEDYREQAARDPDRYRQELATILANFSDALAGVGRAEEAVSIMRESVDHYRKLAAVDQDRYAIPLARALGSLSLRLQEAGDGGGAAAALEEALPYLRSFKDGG